MQRRKRFDLENSPLTSPHLSAALMVDSYSLRTAKVGLVLKSMFRSSMALLKVSQ